MPQTVLSYSLSCQFTLIFHWKIETSWQQALENCDIFCEASLSFNNAVMHIITWKSQYVPWGLLLEVCSGLQIAIMETNKRECIFGIPEDVELTLMAMQ